MGERDVHAEILSALDQIEVLLTLIRERLVERGEPGGIER